MNVEIWCDGACRGNNDKNSTRLGGFGAILVCGDYIKEVYGWKENTTNNEMELNALFYSLRELKRYDINLTIYADSQYLIDGATKWCKNWSRNNWAVGKRSKIKNLGIWIGICDYLNKLDTYGHVRFVKVKGHSGVPLNERADALANYAMDTRRCKYTA